LAIYFAKTGFEAIDTLPVKKDNGLFYQGDDWDLVIGNPAGGGKYEHDEEQKIFDGGLLNLTEKEHSFSEYELSIQQAVRSAKVGGKICLILPEGFFSNSNDGYLRKFVSKYCKILAIVSLPRGVFKKGTSTKQQLRGSQTSSQKMSILYIEKIKDINKENPIGELYFSKLGYPVFLASVTEQESKGGPIENWLDPELIVVLEQWSEWQQNRKLKEIPVIDIKLAPKEEPKTAPLALSEKKEEVVIPKPAEIKSKTKISEFLEDLFK
jgi:hypothetical protein